MCTRRGHPKERNEPIADNAKQPEWDEQPDGSRVRLSNGIRIVDRSRRLSGDQQQPLIEHLVASPQEDGQLVILGLDGACKTVYMTTL